METKKTKVASVNLFKVGTQLVTSTVAAKIITTMFLPPGTKFLGVALVNIGSSVFGDAVTDVVDKPLTKLQMKIANKPKKLTDPIVTNEE